MIKINPSLYLDGSEIRAMQLSKVLEVIDCVGEGTQSKAFSAIDRDGESVCLKLTDVRRKRGEEFHASWMKSWGKRTFDMPIYRTGYIVASQNYFIRWIVQPLGVSIDEDEYYRMRSLLEFGGCFFVDMCQRQFVSWNSQTWLVDYSCAIHPGCDFNKRELRTFTYFTKGFEKASNRNGYTQNYCRNITNETLRSAIWAYYRAKGG